MRSIQKMLPDGAHPRRLWPTTMDGRTTTSGSSGNTSRSFSSAIPLE